MREGAGGRSRNGQLASRVRRPAARRRRPDRWREARRQWGRGVRRQQP